MDFYGYGEQDFIPCIMCGGKACDVHHIDRNKLNNHPSSLQILTREEHKKVHGR